MRASPEKAPAVSKRSGEEPSLAYLIMQVPAAASAGAKPCHLIAESSVANAAGTSSEHEVQRRRTR